MSLSHENLPPDCPAAAALPVVRLLITTLRSHGYHPVKVFDGEEFVKATTDDATLDAVFAVDDSTIYFRKVAGKSQRVMLINCNGDEVISDHSCGDEGFNRAMDEVFAKLEAQS